MSSVDVVVPCYNYARFLPRCVASILRQEGIDVRVLVIDDASSDNTALVGQQLSNSDPRVEFRRHETNKGHIATYNEGLLAWASADYSLLLSADDALPQGALARACELMDRHPQIGMTYGMARTVMAEDDTPDNDEPVAEEYRIVPGSKFLQFCCEHVYNPVPTPTAVVRTKLQHRLGGYRADFPHTGDLEMWMRFAASSEIGVLRAVQGYYRWHGGNMASQYYSQVLGDRREFAQTCKYVLNPLRERFPDAGLWLETMRQRMDSQAFWLATTAFDRGEMEECMAWMEFAKDISPGRRLSAQWWRLRAKKLLGNATWRTIAPTVNRLRGIPHAPPVPRETSFVSKRGQEIGWWPASVESSPAQVTITHNVG